MDNKRNVSLSFPFQIDPWTHHVSLCDETQRIRNSVFLILSIHVKEVIMMPSFGSRLKDYVFENQSVETQEMIRREVIASLHAWEPWIYDIDVSFQREEEILLLTVSYIIRMDGKADSLSIPLEFEGE